MAKATTTNLCKECGAELRPVDQGRICAACKWVKRPRIPCVDCGQPSGWTVGNKRAPGVVICRPCRSARVAQVHGTEASYNKRKCRCDECRAAAAAAQRGYNQRFREREGYCIRERYAGSQRCWISRADRLAIYERDNWTCQMCLDPIDSTLPASHRKAATLDHIVCQSHTLFPDNSPENLRLLCRSCNSKRGNRDVVVPKRRRIR